MASITLKIDKGVNNRQDPIALGKLTDYRDPSVKVITTCENMDVDDNGVATRREGRVSVLAATSPHSFFVHPFDATISYFVEGGVLKKFNTDYTATTVTTFAGDLPVSFEMINSEVICSNGVEIGWLSGATFEAFVGSSDPGGFYATMLPGRYLALWNSTLWVANGSVLGFSLPRDVQTRDTRFCRIPLPGSIRMLAAVEDGLWLATDKKVSFIKGSGPDDLTFVDVSDVPPPDGCFAVAYEEFEGGNARVVYWASPDGFCAGRAGGKYANLSPDTALPAGSSGVCVYRNNNGIDQCLATIRDPALTGDFNPDTLVTTTIHI